MNFWSPTKAKLTTTILLILLWLVFSVISALTQKAYDKYSFELLVPSNYSKGIEGPSRQCIKSTRSARLDITTEMVSQLEMVGFLSILIQTAVGLLIAYFGSCVIYRIRSKDRI